MKVIHILKRMETIDEDIKDLRKMEKSLAKNKSFTTPIYMSIEKQINILLGERVKLLELQILNPPPELVEQIEGPIEEREVIEEDSVEEPVEEEALTKALDKPKKSKAKKTKSKSPEIKKNPIDDDIEIPIVTQDSIDEKFDSIKAKREGAINIDDKIEPEYDEDLINDENVKLLDVALEKGTLNKTEIDKEKKKVKFFKDNFPSR